MTRNQTEHPGDRPPTTAPPAPDGTPAPDRPDAPAVPDEPPATLINCFRAAVARFGDRLAVHDPSGSWTYRELDLASDALAARIRPTAGPDAPVALWCGHDRAAVAALLAVLKTGAAYLPLDPQQPTARSGAALAATGPALILTDAAHARAAERAAEGRPVLRVATAGDEPADPPIAARDASGVRDTAAARNAAGAPACVRPDGTSLTDRELLAHAFRFAGRLALTPDDRVPLVARHALDDSAPELFGALLSGASLHLVNPYAAPPATLLADLARQRATVLHCTPDLLRLFLVQLAAGGPAPGLRAVVLADDGGTAGAPLGDGETADLARYFPAAELFVEPAPRHRPEPAEAEVLLRAHPTVRHAAVLADPTAPPGHRLIGYTTSPGVQAAAPEELLRYLRGALPEYAVPHRIVVLPRLPLDPAGRLDRSRLPTPSAAEATEPADGLPSTTQERRAAALWCEVLGRDSATLADQFFAHGGDSARVMQLLQRVRAEYGVALSVPAFLAAPTLRTLTRLLAAAPPSPAKATTATTATTTATTTGPDSARATEQPPKKEAGPCA
ncbi:non-ribosomal peptide synthetase [Kitasatospora sp. NPDC086791]|uniref:non-ribosomal peptide synthetase n=1 Tax=Kitasatospora sp. NPDC086791 TaxID=3155178 RepID=UPI0034316F48